MLGKKALKKLLEADLMQRGDVYYTTGVDHYAEGIRLIHPDRLQQCRDGTILYEVHVARKVRINIAPTITNIR